MVLSDLVFFPHNMAPLRIFEPRYLDMLREALDTHRMFAICRARSGGDEPCEVGGLGIIRACVENDDGTSNLILQGLHRVRFVEFTRTRPLHIGVPRVIPSTAPPDEELLHAEALEEKIIETACGCPELTTESRTNLRRFLGDLEDFHALVDIVAGNFIRCPQRRQEILETGDAVSRLRKLAAAMQDENSGTIS